MVVVGETSVKKEAEENATIEEEVAMAEAERDEETQREPEKPDLRGRTTGSLTIRQLCIPPIRAL